MAVSQRVKKMGEEHFRVQIEHFAPSTPAVQDKQKASPFQRERITELSTQRRNRVFEAKIEQNEKILRLHKAKKDLEVRNKNLDVAFKTRIEEITKLKTRIAKLETENKGL